MELPVTHLSASSIKCYLNDRQQFFRRYVRYIYDDKKGPALILGSLFHSLLEDYYDFIIKKEEFNLDDLIKNKFDNEKESIIKNENIDWGKTGSIEKLEKQYFVLAENYFNNLPDIYNPLLTEEKILVDVVLKNGEKVTIKMFIDLLWKTKNGNIIIEDHKTVTTFTDKNKTNPGYLIQACANYYGALQLFGKAPSKAIFREIKKTKNSLGLSLKELSGLLKANSIEIPIKAKKEALEELVMENGLANIESEVQQVIIEFTDNNLSIFNSILERMTKELSGEVVIEDGIQRFLPNPFAMFGGEESWNDFTEEVISGSIPIIGIEKDFTDEIAILDI